MRDPYHNARQRFKVARDRYCEAAEARIRTSRRALLKAKSLKWSPVPDSHYRRRRELFNSARREVANSPLVGEPLADELTIAAGILHTMLKWKCQDERQALMLWKLSRD